MKSSLLLYLLLAGPALFAQLNATLRSNLDYADNVNDVWGYVAPDRTEYALVGTDFGVSVVSLADPDNATEVAFAAGDRSTWRDIKTWRGFAYAVADEGDDGLTVIDLRELPERISVVHHQYTVPGAEVDFARAHNLYIDTLSALAYTAGGNRKLRDGGVLIFDLRADPLHPPLVALGPAVYSHDVYVQDSVLYCSEIYRGELAIYDGRDLDSIVEIGRTLTPYTFTHNAWTNDDASVVFTTDETRDAPVAAFDISDPGDIRPLDEYRPAASLNTGTIPHNVHVIDNYLSISYYTDGLRVADASVPTNIVEVANYDTWDGADGGFNGNWGAYPYLPSGLTLVSDRQTGLYVVDVNYRRAARLGGRITEQGTGLPVNAAAVRLDADQANLRYSDPRGDYATGLANGGSYRVQVTAPGYFPTTTTVSLVNGTTATLDIELRPRPRSRVRSRVVSAVDGSRITNARVELVSADVTYEGLTDSLGRVDLTDVYEDEYRLLITAWGFRPLLVEGVATADLVDATYTLERGYVDPFVSDLGWRVSGNARRGSWARGAPAGTRYGSAIAQPGFDAPGDLGDEAYVTGLAGGQASADDVDNGSTVLASPPFDPTYLDDPELTFQYWFTSFGEVENPPNDTLVFHLSNGIETVELARYAKNTTAWTRATFRLADFLEVTDSMQLFATASDNRNSGNVTESGLDDFAVGEQLPPSSTGADPGPTVRVTIYPNPTSDRFTLDYGALPAATGRLRVYAATGRRVADLALPGTGGRLPFGDALPAGFYFLELTAGGRRVYAGKAIKR